MRRLVAALALSLVSVGAALASPAMTIVPTTMRQSPNSHAAVVQSIPANAVIDITGCGKLWCSASWRDIPGFVRARSIDAAPGAAPLVDADEPPPPGPVYVGPPPLVIAPFGCCWGGWGYRRHYY
jgi:uncharacterized protein YraI